MKILKVRKIDAKWDGMELWQICQELRDKSPKEPSFAYNGDSTVRFYSSGNTVGISIVPVSFGGNPSQIEAYSKHLLDCVKYARKCEQELKNAGFDVKYGR